MEKIIVKKRTAEEMACWKVPCEGACPNTEIVLDPGLILLVYVEGDRKMTSKSGIVLNSLMNPGKGAKLIGGKKPYASCEIFAVDIASEFRSEWGLAGPNAMPCFDPDFKVDAKAVCFGEYFYNVEDFFSFVTALPLGEKGQITREDVRELFRAQTVSVAKSHLLSKLATKGLPECQARLPEYAEEIKEQLNRSFDSKGITLHSFNVSTLDYEPAHKALRDKLKDAKVDVEINAVTNVGRRDDISVAREQSEVDIAYINAINGARNNAANNAARNNAAAPTTPVLPTVICPRCGEKTQGNYCHKCGMQLNKNA